MQPLHVQQRDPQNANRAVALGQCQLQRAISGRHVALGGGGFADDTAELRAMR